MKQEIKQKYPFTVVFQIGCSKDNMLRNLDMMVQLKQKSEAAVL